MKKNLKSFYINIERTNNPNSFHKICYVKNVGKTTNFTGIGNLLSKVKDGEKTKPGGCKVTKM